MVKMYVLIVLLGELAIIHPSFTISGSSRSTARSAPWWLRHGNPSRDDGLNDDPSHKLNGKHGNMDTV